MELDMKSRMHFTARLIVKSRLLILGLVLSLCSSVSAESILWKTIDKPEFEVQAKSYNDLHKGHDHLSEHSFENAQLMTLNDSLMRDLLNLDSSGIENNIPTSSTLETSAKSLLASDEYEISLPLPNGTIIDLTLVKDSILPPELSSKYPRIHTYRVLANKAVFGGKVDISPNGFHAMLQMFDGEVVFIDPVEINTSEYAIYHKSTQKSEGNRQHSCGVSNESFARKGFVESILKPSAIFSAREENANNGAASRSQDSLKNYTIAIATTGEYSAKFGSSVGGTMAAIVTTLNRVNQVLERDLGIRLNLVENNDLLINTNADSDPYTEEKLIDLVLQNQVFIDSTIGNSNYDIGHLFTTKGGGLAAIASICNNGDKAKCASGITSPRGDSFDLDFVAHEIGHQLGATHTFNSTQGACSAQTREARSAFEPGSGSSIMSYAGYCGLDNIQSNTDAMYHIGSIKQITDYTNNGLGNRCGVVRSSQNTPPKPNAGRDFNIPARTPFELKGKATDDDGDSLIYAWEQLDAGETSTESSDKGNNALFRVHIPDASNSRTFPPLKNILNKQPAKGEALPNFQRNLTMSFVAQDGFNAAVSDEMLVKVIRTGSRFALNYPRAFYTRGNTYPVFWNVANTNRSPINCSSVNVLLSVDGGNNFNYLVANNVPNIGETSVTIPADVPTSTQGRFKLECSDNIFFAVSYRNFFVTESDDSVSIEYNNEDQAETNLKDLPLNAPQQVVSSSVTNANVPTERSGGGNFDFLISIFVLVFIRQKYYSSAFCTRSNK